MGRPFPYSASRWPSRPLILGIVNVTPDSFSDGGQFARWDRAVDHALGLAAEGADLLDVGGESTRPGAQPVVAQQELDRVLPVIRALAGEVEIPISVDTRRAEVAAAALAAGATVVNDVSALADGEMADVVAQHDAGLILMHMQGEPESMQEDPHYADVVGEVSAFLAERATRAQAAGVAGDRIWLDPGFGFGKKLEHNLQLFARGLDPIAGLGYPVVIGASRKRFIEHLDSGAPVRERLPGSLAAAGMALMLPRAVVRVHDVAATRQYLKVRRAVEQGRPQPWDEAD